MSMLVRFSILFLITIFGASSFADGNKSDIPDKTSQEQLDNVFNKLNKSKTLKSAIKEFDQDLTKEQKSVLQDLLKNERDRDFKIERINEASWLMTLDAIAVSFKIVLPYSDQFLINNKKFTLNLNQPFLKTLSDIENLMPLQSAANENLFYKKAHAVGPAIALTVIPGIAVAALGGGIRCVIYEVNFNSCKDFLKEPDIVPPKEIVATWAAFDSKWLNTVTLSCIHNEDDTLRTCIRKIMERLPDAERTNYSSEMRIVYDPTYKPRNPSNPNQPIKPRAQPEGPSKSR